MKRIQRALISVFDKRGIVDFARALGSMDVEILSTGSTGALLEREGVPVRKVAEVTGFPEILGGRVKTLHPKIHGGILAVRDDPGHREELERHGIDRIDLVAVNLYPFSETIRRDGVSFQEVIENIDIGGPSMLRAAAKNFQDVAVVTRPEDYDAVIADLEGGGGILGTERLFGLAQAAFRHTASYDQQISRYLERITWGPEGFRLPSPSIGS